MKPILIIGPDNSGKTRLALEMTSGSSKRGHFNCRSLGKRTIQEHFKFGMDWIPVEADSFVIDDTPINIVKDMISFFSQPTVPVIRKGKPETTISTPQLLIVSTCELEELKLSTEERKMVTVLETSIDADNYLNIRVHEAHRIEAVSPFHDTPRPARDWAKYKIKLIIGESPSELLGMAKSLALNKKYVVIDGKNAARLSRYSFNSCNRDTELIIVDNPSKKRLHEIVCALYGTPVTVDRRGESAFRIEVDVIITCIGKKEEFSYDPSTRRRIEVIECICNEGGTI